MRKMFFSLLAFLLFTGISSAQTGNTDYPKGRFVEVNTPSANYGKLQTIYRADAAKLAADWLGEGFGPAQDSGKLRYATGRYLPGSRLAAQGPEIVLPKVAGGEKLILQLNGWYETERNHDHVYVELSAGGESREVYLRSGKSGETADYADLTRYAGQTVRLSLGLSADESYEGAGWSLASLELYTAREQEPQPPAALRAAAAPLNGSVDISSSKVASLTLLNVAEDNFPDMLHLHFAARDAGGNFVEGLTAGDIKVTINGKEVAASCKKQMVMANNSMTLPVDITFIVDNSGSMQNHYQNVSNNIVDLVRKIGENFSAQAGLYRYGFSGVCPKKMEYDPITYNFFSSITGENLQTRIQNSDKFLSDIWIKNEETGDHEFSYDVLYDMTKNLNLNYRPNAQKVLVLITDERIFDGYNQYNCDGSPTVDKQVLIKALQDGGFQVFTIIDPQEPGMMDDFDGIASGTGGVSLDINAPDYGQILTKMGNVINERYVLSIACLDDINTDECTEIKISVQGKEDVQSIRCPILTEHARMVRTPDTRALDNRSVPQNIPVEIGVQILDIPENVGVDKVVAYYRHGSTGEFTEQETTLDGDETYVATVPANMVDAPHVEYYFQAIMSDGSRILTSPEGTDEYVTWTFAVLPNYPPEITNVVIGDIVPCTPATVCATITDATEKVSSATLYYRAINSPGTYTSVTMSCEADRYCADILAGAVKADGIEYYIQALDNYGSQAWYGTPERPFQMQYKQKLPGGSRTATTVGLSVFSSCNSFQPGDTIMGYYTNECGDLMIGGYGIVGAGDIYYMQFKIYEDSPETSYKDGFKIGDNIVLRLVRDGITYDVDVSGSLTYNSSWSSGTAILPPSPARFDVLANWYMVIENGTKETSPANNTDFGISQSPVTKTFTIRNSGCSELKINGISSDNEHFSVSPPSSFTVQPYQYFDFQVTYDAQENAKAEITISSSNSNTNKYTFAVSGKSKTTEIPSTPCDGVVLESNPMPNNSNAKMISVELAEDMDLTIYITDLSGEIKGTAFSGYMGKGTHRLQLQNMESMGLQVNTYYLISVKRGNMPLCSSLFSLSN